MLILGRFAHPMVLALVLFGQGEQRDAEPLQRFLYFAIESLTLFVNDSIAINHRRLVKYISKTGTVVISEIIVRAILRKYTSVKIISRSTAVTLFSEMSPGCCNANENQIDINIYTNI